MLAWSGALIYYAFKDIVQSKFRYALLKLSGATLCLLLIPILPPLLLGTQLIVGIVDIFRTAFRGVSEGYQQGLTHVLEQFLKSFVFFSSILRLISFFINRADIVPAVARPSFSEKEFSALEDIQEETKAFTPLAVEEIELTCQKPELESVLNQYKSLYERLQLLDKTIKARSGNYESDESFNIEDDGAMDQLMSFIVIVEPILLVKRYQDGRQWRIVPTSTQLTDKDNLKAWLKTKDHHPSAGESLKKPGPYMDRPTKYCYHAYRTMADSQELREVTVTIRQSLQSLKAEEKFSFAKKAATFFAGSERSKNLDVPANTQSAVLTGLDSSEDNSLRFS